MHLPNRLELPLRKRDSPSIAVLLASVSLLMATGAAAAAIVLAQDCKGCIALSDNVGGTAFALIGGIVYCAAILLLASRSTRLFGRILVSLGFGIHIVLVKAMFDSGNFCGPCATAAGASAVSFIALMIERTAPRTLLASGALVAMASFLAGTLWFAGSRADLMDELLPEYVDALNAAKSDCRSIVEESCIVVLERQGCAACALLDTDDKRANLANRTGSMLRVLRREAPDGMPVPTVIVGTATRWTVFRGAPDEEQLLRALDQRE